MARRTLFRSFLLCSCQRGMSSGNCRPFSSTITRALRISSTNWTSLAPLSRLLAVIIARRGRLVRNTFAFCLASDGIAASMSASP
ncbi:hypothetical protein BKA63DRAFT_519293 [Paraphoma chrysanthemicola]|nr:hypothetical protein BKA63DRAFT_519293 [Paraphoma chrysanthemicola]